MGENGSVRKKLSSVSVTFLYDIRNLFREHVFHYRKYRESFLRR